MRKPQESKAVLVLLALVVVASGCANSSQQKDTAKTDPVVVNDFSATPNPVPAARTLRLRAELQNNGDTDAQRVAARIGGPTFATGNGQPLAWREAGNTDDEDGKGMSSKQDRTKLVGELPAPAKNQAALPKTVTFTLLAPAYGQGRQSTDSFRLQVFYNYSTTASTDLTLMTQSRYQETGATKSSLTLDNTAGPVQMDIRGTSPKVYYSDGTSDQVCVVVRNDGPGQVFDASEAEVEAESGYYNLEGSGSSSPINSVEITVRDIGNINFETVESGDDSGRVITKEVNLINGEKGSQCFKWSVDGQFTQEEQTIPFQVEADYGYVKETSTTVTVEGRRGVEGPSDGSGGGESGNQGQWKLTDGQGNDKEFDSVIQSSFETNKNRESFLSGDFKSKEVNVQNFCDAKKAIKDKSKEDRTEIESSFLKGAASNYICVRE